MNKENVKKAIAIMESVVERDDKFNMNIWRGVLDDDVKPPLTEARLRACGTAACFAGWVAVSPEFRTDGGVVGVTGAPRLGERIGAIAIAKWLEIPKVTAGGLCCYAYSGSGGVLPEFYNVNNVADVTPQMVITKLNQLLAGEL